MRLQLVCLLSIILPFMEMAAAEDVAEVTGSVAYLQRIALPKEAVVQVQLVDVSLQDAPAVIISEQAYTNRQVPIKFYLKYDPTQIKPSHDYAIQANITVGGKLWFINTQRYSVLTKDNSNKVDLVLEMVK